MYTDTIHIFKLLVTHIQCRNWLILQSPKNNGHRPSPRNNVQGSALTGIFSPPVIRIARMRCPLRWSTASSFPNHGGLVLAQRLPDCVANCHHGNISHQCGYPSWNHTHIESYWDIDVKSVGCCLLSDPRGSTRESASGRAPQLSSFTRN